MSILRLIKKVLPIIIFVVLDQFVKLFISNNMMVMKFNLIGTMVQFKPYLNVKYSWFNSMTNLGISRLFHIIVVLITLVIAILIYDFINTKYSIKIFGHLLFSFLFAGAICSLIDKLLWGGSLDYILIKGFFIFDLKDVYLTVFEIMLVLVAIRNKDLRHAKGNVVVTEFIEYFKVRYIKKFKNS